MCGVRGESLNAIAAGNFSRHDRQRPDVNKNPLDPIHHVLQFIS
jgi:hypothetical protein